MADHSSRIAVVTGAGSGIGAAVALALADDGWVVVLAGRRPEALASVAARGAELAGAVEVEPRPGWREPLCLFVAVGMDAGTPQEQRLHRPHSTGRRV